MVESVKAFVKMTQVLSDEYTLHKTTWRMHPHACHSAPTKTYKLTLIHVVLRVTQ